MLTLNERHNGRKRTFKYSKYSILNPLVDFYSKGLVCSLLDIFLMFTEPWSDWRKIIIFDDSLKKNRVHQLNE